MLKRNPCGFTRKPFSASAVLILAAASAAALSAGDPCSGCAAFPAAYAQSAVTITTSNTPDEVRAAFGGLDSGGVVTFSSGTHANLGLLSLTKSMTVTGEPGAVLSGWVRMLASSSDITIQNLTFNEITQTWAALEVGTLAGGDVANVTLSNNTMSNTRGNGTVIRDVAQSTITNLRITDSVYRNIGTFYPPGFTEEQKAGSLFTAIRTIEQGLLRDLFISDNVFDTATFAGINLGKSGVINGHVNGNTMSNMPASAIQKVVERTHDEGTPNERKLSGPDAGLQIYGNTITGVNTAGADNAERTTSYTLRAPITVRAEGLVNTRIYDNTISDSHHGILLCVVTCRQPDGSGENSGAFRTSDAPLDSPLIAFRNSFAGNTGFDAINLAPSRMFAPFNYWGASPAERISGDVTYSPYYTDAAQTATAEISRQQSGITPQQPACSVSAGEALGFDLVTGGESAAVTRTVTNAGTTAVAGLRLQVDSWTDRTDNEYGTLTTQVKVGGEFVDLVPGQPVDVGSPLSSPGTAELEFKVVHSGRVLPTGEGSLSQAMTLFASCG